MGAERYACRQCDTVSGPSTICGLWEPSAIVAVSPSGLNPSNDGRLRTTTNTSGSNQHHQYPPR